MTGKQFLASVVLPVALIAFAFLFGLYQGREIAIGAIKSELVWYNESQLKLAIDEMHSGNLESAEKRIAQVIADLNRMKDR